MGITRGHNLCQKFLVWDHLNCPTLNCVAACTLAVDDAPTPSHQLVARPGLGTSKPELTSRLA